MKSSVLMFFHFVQYRELLQSYTCTAQSFIVYLFRENIFYERFISNNLIIQPVNYTEFYDINIITPNNKKKFLRDFKKPLYLSSFISLLFLKNSFIRKTKNIKSILANQYSPASKKIKKFLHSLPLKHVFIKFLYSRKVERRVLLSGKYYNMTQRKLNTINPDRFRCLFFNNLVLHSRVKGLDFVFFRKVPFNTDKPLFYLLNTKSNFYLSDLSFRNLVLYIFL